MFSYFLLLFVLLFFFGGSKEVKGYVDVPFEDVYVGHRFLLSTENIAEWDHFPNSEVPIALLTFSDGESVIYQSESSLYVGEKGQTFKWTRIDDSMGIEMTSDFRIRVSNSGSLIVAGNETVCLIECQSSVCTLKEKDTLDVGKVNQVVPDTTVVTSSSSYFIASKLGLLYFSENGKLYTILKSVEVTSVAIYEKADEIAVGTKTKLFLFDSDDLLDPSKWYHYWVGGVIGEEITTLAYSRDENPKLYVGNKRCVNVFDRDSLQWSRVGGLKGLPYPSVTTITSTDSKVYVGTEKGLCMLDLKTNEWQYFYLDRFLHGSKVLSLSPIPDSDSIFALTESGASLLSFMFWTLEDKAQHYQDQVYPRHDRYGLVSDVGLSEYGDLRSYYKKSSDNDGLWTSIYLVSQIYRYATTKSEDAKKTAWAAFRGLQLLNNVTGIKGFMARSVLARGDPIPGGEWFNSTVYPYFQFKGDTSSDEVTGHINAFSLFYDLVAETEEDKQMVEELVDDIVTNIISNEYILMDYDGKPTTWGIWRPHEINDESDWMTDRGLNSLEMVAYILSAYRITGKQVYLDSYKYLVNENFYGRNIINQKIEVIGDVPENSNINHSDDELSFLSFLIAYYALEFLPSSEFDEFRGCLGLGIEQNYDWVSREESSMFDVIYAYSLLFSDETSDRQKYADFNITNMVGTLKTYPLSLIDWPYDNTKRIDVLYNPEKFVREELSDDENMNVLPYNEIGCSRWNCNPYSMSGGSGYSETDPGVWLFGYWMARYYKFIT